MRVSSFLVAAMPVLTTLVESKALYLYETVYVTVAFKDGQEYTVYDDFNKESVPTAIKTEANFETPIVVPETQEEQHEPLEPTIPNQDPDPIPELVPEPVEEPISVPEYIEEQEPQYEPEHEAVPVEEPVPAPIQVEESVPAPAPKPQKEEEAIVIAKQVVITTSIPAETKAPEPEPQPEPQQQHDEPQPEPQHDEPEPEHNEPEPQKTKEVPHEVGSSLPAIAEECLTAHNSKRSRHGVGPLKWSSKLESFTNSVASSYDCSGSLQHTRGPYGENLALGYKSTTDAVNAWYDEGSQGEFNHFTQVVWKSTTELACSAKDCRANGFGLYVICVYSSPGNVAGQWKENVLPLNG